MQQPEAAIQRAVIQHIIVRGQADMLWWHTPNSGKRSKTAAHILKGLGVLPGVADLLFLRDGKLYSLELKAPGGRLSNAQIAWRQMVNRFGGFAAVANGLDAAIKTLETWGLLRVAKS